MKLRPEDRIVHTIISGEVHLNYLEQVKHTRHWEKSTKNKGNLFLKELQKNTKYFEILEASVEDSTLDCHDQFYDYIKAVSSVTIPHMSNVIAIIEAYKKEPKIIEEAVNKALKL